MCCNKAAQNSPANSLSPPDPVSVNNISVRIPEDEDLSRGLYYPPKHKPSHGELLKEYLGMLSSADNPSPSGKAASFISLSGSKVQVEFDVVHRRLQLQALETACRNRHGNEGVRVMRLLLETGKMDEKQVNSSFPAVFTAEALTPADL